MDLLASLLTWEGSAVVVLVLAVLTAIACEALNQKLLKFVEAAEWWPRAAPLQQGLMMNFGYPEEACTPEVVLDSYAFVCVIVGHHVLTGCLTLPVVWSGWSGAGQVGQVMFLCGGLADVAYDIYDFAKKFALCFFPKTFRWMGAPCPLPFFIMLGLLHHPLAMSLVIPMNLKYFDLRAYHFIISSLLLAAGICFLSGQYKFTLDIAMKRDFKQYKMIVALQFVVIWFTRCFVWFSQLYTALMHFRAQEDRTFFIGGCIAGALMSLFNVVMLLDSTQAAVKWLPKPLPHDEKQCDDVRCAIVRQECKVGLIGLPAPEALGFGAKKFRGTATIALAVQKFKLVKNKNR